MTGSAYTDEANDWEYQPLGPFEQAAARAPEPIVIDSLKMNEFRRTVGGEPVVRRVIRPSAEVERATIGDRHVLETRESDQDGNPKVRRWTHETLFVPLVVEGRSTAELAGASANVFGYWKRFGKVSPRDSAHNRQGDVPWSLKDLADREIVWFMTQELPSEYGWRARWDALGQTRHHQEHVVMAHPELAVELLALRK